MSDVIEVTSDYGDYTAGHTYRVRSRNAQEMQALAVADILEDKPVPVITEEGV